MKTMSDRVALPHVFFRWALAGIAVLLTVFLPQANAHHPLEGQIEPFSLFQGFVSGLAHPLLGLDHLLFLSSIGMTALVTSLRWIPALLGFGMVGSLFAFIIPSIPGSEMVMGLSLVVSALVLVRRLSPTWIVPFIVMHGYVLAGLMVGSEPTPLAGYFLGLLLSEAILITTGILLVQKAFDHKTFVAGALIGIGLSMTYGTLLN